MESFKEYLISEFKEKVKGYAAVETKFSHTYNLKTEAKSEIIRRNDLIKVSLLFVDKNLNQLFSTTVIFENNSILKRLYKSFVNITPKELENRFNAAKDEICKDIMKEYLEKKNELNTKIKNLKSYCQVAEGIISSEFRGESVIIVDEPKKFEYDM